MAVRRLAERPTMQLVGLDEDATDASPPVRSAPDRLRDAAAGARSWASQRPAAAVVATLSVLALLTGVVLAGPQWLSRRERAQVLGPAAFVGAVHSLRSAPEVRWRVDVDGAMPPVLVDDVLVVAAGSADARDRRVVGLDAVTGETRWTVPLGTDPVPDTVSCRSTGPLLTCVAGPAPQPDRRDLPQVPDGDAAPGAVWAIDPTDGTVRAQHPGAGWTLATAAVGSDLVVAAYTAGRLTIRRLDPVTGKEVWAADRLLSGSFTPVNGRIRLVAAGDLVMVTRNDSTLLLDAATGQREARGTATLGAEQTTLDPDGTVVRQEYRLLGSAIVARSSLANGMDHPWLFAEGSVLSVDVADGSSDLTFTTNGLGVDGIRAYRAGVDQQVWQTPTRGTRVSVAAAGRVVVRNAGTLAGLDAADGSVAWVRDLGAVSGPALTDGRRVGVLTGGLDDRAVLVALDLEDGRLAWQLPLPPGTSRVVRLGTQLYAVGDHALVALR
ncbi:PQQ-binding-like beta-propeller repeat protein [Cellulomonas sp. URHD0024]|uniref:outer membrane protein assembly factor BamB family protein n=1 Tax=Cellulomonas sp. URHD0024 TaxID=1302620 RepID=UPI000488271E|nr:PQQ-binding-like beta-propeller repeat protein [Cellulomonas sp. URHD0024]